MSSETERLTPEGAERSADLETTARARPARRSTGEPGGQPAGLMWGVGAVSTRLGIATPTLRTWERRYGLGPRARTAGGHRRYSEEDVTRVSLMARLVARGVPPQAAARVALSLDAPGLADAMASPDGDATRAAGAGRTPLDGDEAVRSVLDAAHALDASALHSVYSTALGEHGVVDAWAHVLAPALREIGDRWFDGTLGVDSEHLASEVMATELRALVRGRRPQRMARPPVVLASAEDEQHSLPLLATEAALAADGIAGYALGGRLPAPALTDMVQRVRPGVVLLWASIARPRVDAVWSSFDDVSWPLTVLLGGPGWHRRQQPTVEDVEVRSVEDLASAVAAIGELTSAA